jgi:hypothetical protein
MTYETQDIILPILKIPDPCPIKITTDDKYIKLFIAGRDWSWNLDGTLIGTGTCCGETK